MSITTEDPAPPRKKIKQSLKKTSKPSNESRLFVPFRALGLVTNHVPFVLQTRSHKGATDGPRIHILTCLGKSWALWNGAKMDLLFVDITRLKSSRNHIVIHNNIWIAAIGFDGKRR
ncbi:hypothetical protein PM082_013345 [Marasmius tenuissimus]|nr:hypothetical protein PM082_013345 [Marasmius tenuissimus]